MRRSPSLTLLALAALVVLAGCGGSGTTSGTKATTTSSTTAPATFSSTTAATSAASTTASSTTTAPSTTTTTTTAAAATPARCKAAQLNITHGQALGAAGHIGVPIVWENSSSTPCLMTGWAGADGLDANGASATHAVRTQNGYMAGIPDGVAAPQVLLRPGDSASSFVEGSDVPAGNATSCPSYAGLLVTPPEDTTSVKLDVALPGCSPLQIHPVVAGTTGTQR